MEPPRPLHRHSLGILVLAVLAWAGASLRCGFAYDDSEVLSGNPVIEGTLPWSAVVTTDYWAHSPAGAADHFRPLATASLRIDHGLWGDRPAGYHATNLLLHLLVLLAASRLARGLAGRGFGTGALLGLAVFAIHPALADSVAWISGRTSMLSCLGGLAGVLLLESRRRPSAALAATAAALAVVLGTAGKEDGVIFGLVAVGVASTRGRTRAAMLGTVLGVGVSLAWRALALGGLSTGAGSPPLAEAHLFERLSYGGAAFVTALANLAAPLDPPSGLGLDSLTPLTGFPALAAWVLLGTSLVGGITVALRAGEPGRRLCGVSLALAALALLPWSQLVPIGELFGSRMLYLPLLLGAPALDEGLRRLLPRRHIVLTATGAATLILLAWSSTSTYVDRESYWRARLRHEPASPNAWNALGNAMIEKRRGEEAVRAWERAIELDPAYSRPWTNLGTYYLESGMAGMAIDYLEQAARVGPRNPIAWANLGNARLRASEPFSAITAYERAVDLSPGAAALWRGLARARLEASKLDGARAAVERALELSPQDPGSLRLSARIEAVTKSLRDGPGGR